MIYYKIILSSKDGSIASTVSKIRNEAKRRLSNSKPDMDLFAFENKKTAPPNPWEKKSDNFYSKTDNNIYFSLCNITDESIILCAIVRDVFNYDIDIICDKFCAYFNIEFTEKSYSEITFNELNETLEEAADKGYIGDADRVLKFFNIENISSAGLFNDCDKFSEYVISDRFKAKEDIYKEIKKHLYASTLTEEIDRIYLKPNNNNVRGHAVAYKVLYNSRKLRDLEIELLISALYNNNRLKSRRYTFIKSSDDYVLRDDDFLESLSGGTIVINYKGNEADADESSFYDYDIYSSEDTLSTVLKALKKHKKDILFIFCINSSDTKTESLIDKKTNNIIKTIEISSEILSAHDAAKYLKSLAKKDRISVNSKLTKPLSDKALYNISELDSLYNNWFDETLINSVYDQYKFLKDTSKSEALDKLNRLVGLTEVKSIVEQIVNYSKFQKMFASDCIESSHYSMNMVFYGTPGTAKTTVARLLAEILKSENVITNGNLVECGRSDLVSRYVGWTAPTVKQKFKEAEGGILFIDEAYSLLEERSGLYGDEAINTIVQELENRRNSVIVIFAGYENEMKQFISHNPGLRSRIKFHVHFSDYTASELYDILELFAKNYHKCLYKDVKDKLLPHFSQIVKVPNFGNGRYVRNLIENATIKQATRLIRSGCSNPASCDIQLLKAEDFDVEDVRSI